jgi:hypothetical protein
LILFGSLLMIPLGSSSDENVTMLSITRSTR